MKENMNVECMREGCHNNIYGGGRGMCPNHYSALSFRVKIGKAKWEDLEKEGLARPVLNPERKYRST